MLRAAAAEPQRLFIGIDLARTALEAASTRASRRPERGGRANAWFVHAAAEALPHELDGLADRVTVILPWGSLLAAVLRPDVEVLRGIRLLSRPGASLDIVTSVDANRDDATLRRLGIVEAPSRPRLAAGYHAAGFALAGVEVLDRSALAAIGSTWAGRLAHGRPRPAWRIRATAR